MKKLLFLLLILGVIAMVGCAPGGTVVGRAAFGEACTTNADCDAGLRCSSGGTCEDDAPPVVDSVDLALSAGDLVATVSSSDRDVGDTVRNIVNWLYARSSRLALDSITVLNMPFELGIARDYSGNGNNGIFGTDSTAANALLPERADGQSIDSVPGNALSFDGDNYVRVPDSNSVDVGLTDFSIEAWVNTGDTDGGTLVRHRQPVAPERGYELRVTNTRAVEFLLDFGVVVGSNIRPYSVTGGIVALGDGNWRHVLVTVDRDSEMVLYVDGVQVDAEPIADLQGIDLSALDISNTEPLYMGRGLAGSIDEVRIYNRELTAGQATLLNRGTTAQWTDPALGRWQVEVTPTDGILDGAPVASNRVDVSLGVTGSLTLNNYCGEMGGANSAPALTFSGAERAGSIALVMVDVSANNFVHWFVYGIPPSGTIAQGTIGRNGYLRNLYDGPCPPDGDAPHTYTILAYALDVAPEDVEDVCGLSSSSVASDLLAGRCSDNIVSTPARLTAEVEALSCNSAIPDACAGFGPNTVCAAIGDFAGRCVTANTCGNGLVEGTEQCDDGNTEILEVGGVGITDGCSAQCTTEEGYTCPLAGGTCTLLTVVVESRVNGAACTLNEQCGSKYCDVFTRTAGVCADAVCGDGRVGGTEGCDGTLGCLNYNVAAPSVPLSAMGCTLLCGDGDRDTVFGVDVNGNIDESIVLYQERCDDGNAADDDGCSSSCSVETGFTCVHPANAPSSCTTTCGDGIAAGAEQCDDSNTVNGDGCSATCTNECGDGVRDITSPYTEACDDGNTEADGEDGCSASCTVELGWNCPVAVATPTALSVCTSTCGDGSVAAGAEQCDDGNTANGDGCSSTCRLELLFCRDGVCRADQGEDWNNCPADCPAPRRGCGDGGVQSGEQCDDGNNLGGDGCSAVCTNECGNGFVDYPDRHVELGVVTYSDVDNYIEVCDDGNTDDDDGCSDICTVEAGFSCSGQPSVCYEADKFVSLGGFQVDIKRFTRFQESADRLINSREVVDIEDFIGEIASLLRELLRESQS